MAYNGMYQPYGNPYGNSYGQGYQQPMGQYQMPALQSYGNAPQASGIDWVDGESAARASQLPAGVTQHAMWDINEPVIYVKSVNQMGMPNPLRKLRYVMEEQPQMNGGQSQAMLSSGDQEPHTMPDMSAYIRKDEMKTEDFVKKDDLERMKHELMESIQGISASNGSASAVRRGTKGE